MQLVNHLAISFSFLFFRKKCKYLFRPWVFIESDDTMEHWGRKNGKAFGKERFSGFWSG